MQGFLLLLAHFEVGLLEAGVDQLLLQVLVFQDLLYMLAGMRTRPLLGVMEAINNILK